MKLGKPSIIFLLFLGLFLVFSRQLTVKAASTPYTGTAVSIPGTIQAEDYDMGGEGGAYHDLSSGNTGGEYRTEDVDIKTNTLGGYTVGWIQAGEWLNYSTNITKTGSYTFKARVGSLDTGRTLILSSDGQTVGTFNVPQITTANWDDVQEVTLGTVNLTQGNHVLRVTAGNTGDFFDFDYFSLTSLSGSTLLGDANADGKVDGLDYVIWITNYGATTTSGASKGDFNLDGKVDGLDYVIWITHYGQTASSPSPTVRPSTTPQPTAQPTSTPSSTATPGPTSQPTITPVPTPNNYSQTLYVSPTGSDSNPGTSAQPFKTIQKAAGAARANTLVLISPGTYSGVNISNSGTASQPIVFQSTKRWGAIIDGGNGACTLLQGGQYITIRGIVVQNASWSPYCGAIMPQKGWTMEDILVQKDGDGMDIKGDLFNVDNVTILRSVFQDNMGNSIWGAGNGDGSGSYYMQNLTFKDTLIRRSNQSGSDAGYAYGAMKILTSNKTTGDYITSYDNVGSGWWLDWRNDNFSLTNSSSFSNHGLHFDWEAPGFWCEVNGFGTVTNNLFYNNTGSGLGLLENHNTTATNNTFVDNISVGIEVRSIPDRFYQTSNLVLTNNRFREPGTDGIGGWYGVFNDPSNPSLLNLTFNNNTYDPSTGDWIGWNGRTCNSAATCKSVFGNPPLESGATVASVSLPAGFKSYVVHTTTNSSQFVQVPKTNESVSIDNAVGSSQAGATISIPVYRRGPFFGNGPWTVEVFDLNMRRITLNISNATTKANLESSMSIYTKLDPTNLTVTLSNLSDPYNWQATY